MTRRTDVPTYGGDGRPGSGPPILLHVQPNARRTEVAGRHGDAIKIRVAAPPADGAANEELIRFLADRLKVPKSAVTILRGAGSRHKRVQIRGLDPGVALARLELAAGLSPSRDAD